MASQRMAAVYEKLYKAVSDQNLSKVIYAAYEIFQKPVLFVDEYFHVVSMQPPRKINVAEWDGIFERKAFDRDQILSTLDEFLSGKKAFYEPFYASTGSCAAHPKIFAELVIDDRVQGHLIIFWKGDPPTEEDFEIVRLVLDAIRIRMASRIKTMGSWNLALSTKLEDLISPETPPYLENLACEAISAAMQPEYTICVTNVGQLASQQAFAEYAVQELQQTYRNLVCLIYDHNIVTMYGSSRRHGSGTPLRDTSMARNIFSYFEKRGMLCGLSDSFSDLHTARTHYRQALLTARLSLRLGRDKSTTFSDLMPLPIFLSVLEKDSPETFIHPKIFEMQEYDRTYGTAYNETMRQFSLHMHNKDRTASALNIHRNTLLYRLGRITDLFNIPYEEERDALNLLCSYLILELGQYGDLSAFADVTETEEEGARKDEVK